jgi:rod shape-determining protein MreD
VNLIRALAGLAIVCLAQMLIGQHLPGLARRCDLFSVYVVYIALTRPARPAMLIGGGAGLLQDTLTGVVLGLNGFKKTLLGFLVGTLGSLFMLNQPVPRFGILFAAALFDPLAEWGLSMAMGQHFAFPAFTDLAVLGFSNGILGLAAFWVAARLP